MLDLGLSGRKEVLSSMRAVNRLRKCVKLEPVKMQNGDNFFKKVRTLYNLWLLDSNFQGRGQFFSIINVYY